jgi:hypothetical protein
MLRRRTVAIVLALSLGVNIGLGGIMLYRSARESLVRREARQDFERRRADWSNRERAHADSTRPFPQLEREQVRTLIQMRREAENDIEPLRQEVQRIHSALQEELLAEPTSQGRLDSLIALTADYQERIQARLIQMIQDEEAVLSPEQYAWIVRRMVPGPGRLGDEDRWDRDRRGRDGERGRGGDGDRSGSDRPREEVKPPAGSTHPPRPAHRP